jgi:hypothetical protein
VQDIAPPSISPHSEVVQDDGKVQTDLEAEALIAGGFFAVDRKVEAPFDV